MEASTQQRRCCGNLLSCLRTKPRPSGSPCPHQCSEVTSSLEPAPTAPSLSLVLFNSEEHSDIAFYVGQNGQQWRFPAHSFVVSAGCPVLDAIITRCRSVLEEPSPAPEDFADMVEDMKMVNDVCCITITGIHPDVFETILRFIYTKKVSFRCVTSCLRIFTASLKYQVCSLTYICLEYLSDNVTEHTALEVLSGIRIPRLDNFGDEEDNLRNEVINKCFCLIDNNADAILDSESFENLEQPLMTEIASRDSLKASSEVRVFNALLKWSCQECKRKRMELLVTNKRQLLGDALYSVRFLLMTQEEFTLGPATSGMLTDAEKQSVLSKISGDAGAVVPSQMHCRGRDLPEWRVIKPHPQCSKSCSQSIKNKSAANQNGVSPSKKPKRSRLLNGLGDIMIGVFTLLD